MTHSYTLSWEEFLEMYQQTLPSPSVASLVAMIFIACAMGVFGAVLTYAVDPGSKMTASVFCWMSVALFIAAFWDWRVRTEKRRGRAIRELREVYRAYYSGERSFEFDDEKWTLQTESGRQEIQWSGLLTAVEWSRVVTLSARDQLTVAVPKRVLGLEGLKNLRRMAIEAKDEKAWSSRVNLTDFILTEVPSLWRRHPFLMAEAHIGGLFFFAMIANDMYHTTGPGVYAGWILTGLFLFLTVTAQFWYFLIKYLTSHKEWGIPCDVGSSEKGVRIKRSNVEFFHSWSYFRESREGVYCFLLYFNSSEYYLLPKRCVPLEYQPLLRDLLRSKLA